MTHCLRTEHPRCVRMAWFITWCSLQSFQISIYKVMLILLSWFRFVFKDIFRQSALLFNASIYSLVYSLFYLCPFSFIEASFLMALSNLGVIPVFFLVPVIIVVSVSDHQMVSWGYKLMLVWCFKLQILKMKPKRKCTWSS